MTIDHQSDPPVRLTLRGRVVLSVAWTALFLVGMLTAKYGVPGWDF